MAGVFRGIFGQKEEPSPASSVEEPDFADFDTETADPSPASIIPQYPDKAGSIPANPTGNVVGTGPYTYTKWYRIWERTSIDDFRNELYIIPILALIILSHVWGLRTNRRKAQGWFRVHAPILQQEFAVVGFGKRSLPLLKSGEEAQGEDGKQDYEVTDDFLKEKALNEFITYATGRLNVAALEVKMTLHKRYNPLLWFGDSVLGFFFESFPPPVERVQSVAFAFDGKEAKVVPTPGGNASKELAESRKRVGDSTYDGFVWAVVHKSCLRRLREERYDLSLTATRDHSKLPEWATIMTESAEITDRLLTSELIKAIEVAGDAFEAFIVSDQPLDQPKTVSDTTPIKRVDLQTRLLLPEKHAEETLPIYQQFLQMPDKLVSDAHFRPEAMKKVRQTREEELRKIKKIEDEEKAEERKLKADKEKKEKRDALLKNLSAEEQRKYLEKEREKDARKSQKKRTMRA